MTDFLNKALLSSIISDMLSEYSATADAPQLFYIYDSETEEFCESGDTMYGIPVFNSRGVELYLDAHKDVLTRFVVFRPDEKNLPDMTYPVMTGLEIMQEFNRPQETGGFNAFCSIPH